MRKAYGETTGRWTAERRSARLLTSALLTAALVALTFLVFHVTFLTNDDTSIMYVFAGYRTGSPFPIHGFVNLPLGYLTSWLYTLLPAVPWWAVLQVIAVALSVFVLFASLLNVGRECGVPLWASLTACALLYAAVFVYAVARLSFTLTACMLGAAGVMRLLSADAGGGTGELRDGPAFGAYASSIALMALCLLFRNSTGYSLLCFWGAAVVYRAWISASRAARPARKRILAGLAIYVLAGAALFSALIALNAWTLKTQNPTGFAAFEQARGNYFDFPHVTYDEDPAFFESLGWDREIYDLAQDACFLDEHETADALNRILAYSAGGSASLPERVLAALDYGQKFFRGNGPAEYMLVVPVLLTLWTLVWYARVRRRGVETLIACGAALGSFALCFYLCVRERLILRAFQVIAIPATAVLAVLLPRVRAANAGRPKRALGKAALIALSVLSAAALCWSVGKSWTWLGAYDPSEQIADMRAAEAYAMDHPDDVYIHAPTFIYNAEAFKVYPDGKPTNMIDWGDTGMYSAWKTLQIEQNGISSFSADMFRQENVYLMGTADADELQVLVRYLIKHAGASGIERVDTVGDGYAVFRVVYVEG